MTAEEMKARIDELTHRVELLEAGHRRPYERPSAPGDKHWPAWRYPADGGEGRIFQSADEVPEGWTDKPGVKAPKAKAKAA